MLDNKWIPVHADQEYVLQIELRRLNKSRVCAFKTITILLTESESNF